MSTRHFALIAGIVIFLSGCGGGALVKSDVDSFSSTSPSVATHRHFVLLPASKDVDPSDLEFQEYCRYVYTALTKDGFEPAKTMDDADVIIFMGYGIGNPQNQTYSYALPVFGQTGVASSNTTGTVNSYGGYSTYNGTTTYSPTYGVTGYQTVVGSRTTYFRYLTLDALDLAEYRATKGIIPLWKMTVTSTGSTNDLRLIMPVLVAASQPYLATNTDHKIRVELSTDDSAVLTIKGENH
jgi:hypothetical protein